MDIFKKIRRLLKTKEDAKIKNFGERIKALYGFTNFLYVTSEGLPIIGTFSEYEEIAAKVPELVKALSEFREAEYYGIVAGNIVYTIIRISDEVLMFAEGIQILDQENVQKIIHETQRELGI